MVRKWFKLLGSHADVIAARAFVDIEHEDVASFRVAVLALCSPELPLFIRADDLLVYTREEDFAWALHPSDSLVGVGDTELLIVRLLYSEGERPQYFITPEDRGRVNRASFVVGIGDEALHVGHIAVFYRPTLAVTCDRNLAAEYAVGSTLTLANRQQTLTVGVVHRDPQRNFAILKAATPTHFLPLWRGPVRDLEYRNALVLGSFRLSLHRDVGHAPAFANAAESPRGTHLIHSCSAYTGDAGAAILIQDGCLVGIHQQTVAMLQEERRRGNEDYHVTEPLSSMVLRSKAPLAACLRANAVEGAVTEAL